MRIQNIGFICGDGGESLTISIQVMQDLNVAQCEWMLRKIDELRVSVAMH